jgi:hypothetical protein
MPAKSTAQPESQGRERYLHTFCNSLASGQTSGPRDRTISRSFKFEAHDPLKGKFPVQTAPSRLYKWNFPDLPELWSGP